MAEPFVILLHAGYGEDHYDLMLSDGRVLATWQLPANPAELAAGQSASATRLADHRRDYLTYEGPVSGDRGRVSRAAEGSCETVTRQEGCWEFSLAGEGVDGRFELRRVGPGDDQWRLTRRE